MGSSVVFISYSQRDQSFADRITSDLRAQGINPWMDRERIQPGERWQSARKAALESASAIVVVLSRSFVNSASLLKELEAYTESAARVLPVKLDDLDPSEAPGWLRRLHWTDLSSSYDDGLRALVEGLDSTRAGTRSLQATPARKRNKGYVFVSYAEEDLDFVLEVRRFLKGRGYAYWDYEESDRNYHSQLVLELEGVIGEAAATLSIWTEAWKRSDWAVKEFFFSQDVGTPVFVLRAKEVSPTLAVAGLPYIDFVGDPRAGFEKLGRELDRKGL